MLPSEYLIKIGSKANIDYALVITQPEKQRSLMAALQKNFPTLTAAVVTPGRKLQDKPPIPTGYGIQEQ